MGAISALSTAGSVLRRNPVIFVATLIAALVGNLSLLGQVTSEAAGIVIALVATVVSFLLLPFFRGGTLGMAEEGLTGSTGLRTFLRKGGSNYLSILGAGILIGVVFFVAYIAYLIVAVIVGFGATAVLSTGEGTATGFLGLGFGLLFTVLVLLAIPLFFLLFLFLYFFDVAIVVSDEGAWSGIKRSTRFVRSHFVSALGFVLIRGTLGILSFAPTFWTFFVAADTSGQNPVGGGLLSDVSAGTVLIPVVVSFVLAILLNAFIYTYKAAFYAELAEGSGTDRPEAAD